MKTCGARLLALTLFILSILSACMMTAPPHDEATMTMSATNGYGEGDVPADILPLSPPESIAIPNYSIEVVDFLPYGDNGIRAQPLLASMLKNGEPWILGWLPPSIVPSTDGALWLYAEKGLLRVADRAIFPQPITNNDGVSILHTIVVRDGVLVAVQDKGTLAGMIYHFDTSNQLMWTSPFTLGYYVGSAPQPSFLYDQDGSVYLYTGLNGGVLKVDLLDGTLETLYRFDETYIPLKIWVLNHKLYWYQYHADTKNSSWNEYDLTSGQHRIVRDSPLQNYLAATQAPLPDGGALIHKASNLIWMNGDGTERIRIVEDQLQPIIWNQHTVNTRFTRLYPQSDGTYIYTGAQEEGVYILRLRLTP